MAFENEPNHIFRIRSLTGCASVIGAVLGVSLAAPDYSVIGALAGGVLGGGLSFFWRSPSSVLRPEQKPARRGDRVGMSIEAALENLPVSVLLIDQAGTVTFATKEAESLLQRHSEGLPISMVFRAPAIIAAVEKALEQEIDETVDFRIRRPREMTLTGTVRTLPAGKRRRVLLMLEDRTDRVLVEGARSDFIANASHELRTPLAAISGIVETLQGAAKDDPAAQDRFLGMIDKQTDRMTRLVNDLLSLSRIEADENIQPTQQEDLVDILSDVLGSVQPLTEAANASLETALPEQPVIVQASRDELIQVFVNLIENAIKYAGDAGPVRVKAAVEDDRVRVSIADSGPGIDPDHIPRLTERFYRVDAGASRARGGTGLGLAIVKHIVSRHRGDLKILSNPGQGSEFAVILPTLSGDQHAAS